MYTDVMSVTYENLNGGMSNGGDSNSLHCRRSIEMMAILEPVLEKGSFGRKGVKPAAAPIVLGFGALP